MGCDNFGTRVGKVQSADQLQATVEYRWFKTRENIYTVI